MGADAKQSGSSGTESSCQGQYMTLERKYLGLTLLSALEDPVDVYRCPAALKDIGVTVLGGCCRKFLQGAFKEDFIDGHSSEAIVAMFCSRHLLDLLIRHRWHVHTATGAWNAMMAVWCC